jgi:dTDP-4-amino-4,6-dideoxygalactose transaminase
MDNIHAAILDYKLKKLPAWIERKRQIAKQYYEELCNVKEVTLPPSLYHDNNYYHVFQNLEIETEDRDRLMRYLKENGVEVALPWGGKAVHQFKALGFKQGNLPRTEALFKKVMMLPIYPGLTDNQIKYVAKKIGAFYHG